MINIIENTPAWVLALFLSLMFIGYMQTKEREVTKNEIFLLPIFIIFFSMFSVLSAFGNLMALIIWLFGLIMSLSIGIKYPFGKNVKYIKNENLFQLPGSWLPLALIFIIFCVKYFVGVAMAREYEFIFNIEFIVVVSTLFGAISGIFLSRSIVMFRAKNEEK